MSVYNNTDAAGIQKRYVGERYTLNGRPVIIVENKGLVVLCPCPDQLIVKYLDTNEVIDMQNTVNLMKG